MEGFSDEVYIDVASGNGGKGCVSFRREKFVPKGGPDGGDGGKGGDVVFVVKNNLKTLSAFKTKRTFKAGNGQDGRGNRCFGQNGADVIIPVPPGTCIVNAQTGLMIKDMGTEGEFHFLEGGRGGQGNWHFRSSVNQAPRFAQSGESGSEMRIGLILKLIADVGLVGFPNAGKSSFINCVTNARSKVADYPFTTLIPHLGMMRVYDKDVLIADIPGLIEGAGNGSGMGIKFLKHIERTKMLLFMVDISDDNFLDRLDILRNEISTYSQTMLLKPHLVVATKMDSQNAEKNYIELCKKYANEVIIPLSIFDNNLVEKLKKNIFEKIKAEV